MTEEQEIYQTIHEAIQVMEHYNTDEDEDLTNSIRKMRKLEQKLNKLPVMPVASEGVAQNVSEDYLYPCRGLLKCVTIDSLPMQDGRCANCGGYK